MKSIRYWSFTAALTIIGFTIVGEVVLRLTCVVCSYSEKSGGVYQSPYASGEWRNWYGLRPPHVSTTYNLPEFNYTLITNSLGIRDYNHPLEKDTNEIRIIGLGDSFTEGQGAPIEGTWLQVLERNLNLDAVNYNYRCISGGIYGSDPFISYKLLRNELLSFKPDIVILAINASDILDVMARGGDERFQKNGRVKFADVPSLEWWFFKSHLVRLTLIEFFNYNWYVMSPEEQNRREQKSFSLISNKMLDFKKLSSSHGFKFLFVVHPFSNELIQLEYDNDVSRFQSLAEKENIDFFDLMNHFNNNYELTDSLIEKMFWPADLHHTPLGYKMFAEGILKALDSHGIIKEVNQGNE